ncbi:uncharacterized protein LOC100209933 [Hydra vulgaris]|uniref:uncharacterized protein LOC100209933 n=1 Tax=Hydra vulgaris TaxID=6087 RepID=UPI0001927579|nr:uncharacterized protein LOC100209933 [Hydra vulgaris]
MKLRKKLCVCIIVILIVVFVGVTWKKLDNKFKNDNWIKLRKDHMINYFNYSYKIQKSNSSACVLPSLNAFSPDILKFMKSTYLSCSKKRYGKVTTDGWFILPASGITTVSIRYIYRYNPNNIYINNDFAVKLSDPTYVKEENGVFRHKLASDFIKVDLYYKGIRHVEFHAHVSSQTQKAFKKNAKRRQDVHGLKLDVVFLMIDSQSNANFHRQLLKSLPNLLSDEDTIILNGHTIVGDGTTAQLAAIFIGEHEKDLPETRRSMPNSGTCDQFNFIFKDLHKAGYVTMFSESDPNLSSFHYRLNGFNNAPTSWYLRPFWLAQDSSPKCDFEYSNILLKTFTEIYEDLPKVSLVVNSAVAHNDFNALQSVDDDILEMINYFKSPLRINHTIFIIFGDHGARIGEFRSITQGKLEERLPFFSITLPPVFKYKYPKMFSALKKNSNVLTNHFDIYASLQHILSYPDYPNKKMIGQSLFTVIDPNIRTCKSSGVADHWCPCLNYKKVSVSEKKVIMVAHAVVDYINSLINNNKKAKLLCFKQTLGTILSAGIKVPKNEVSQFIKTNKNKNCDACDIVYDNTIVSKQYYEIVFTVDPSNGVFEANADISPDNSIIVDPNISRINLYGNQPRCIMDEYPHLRPYCYCK